MSTTTPSDRDMANAIRALAMDAVQAANSGHPGMPMGMADVAAVLFREFLKFDAAAPEWPDRDRFILSAGHGSMLLYALLYLNGYPGMDIADIKAFRQLGSKTAGHPEHGHAPGIETTTGPLGQGLANAVGFALAERMLAARHGAELVDHHTYVICGDGCLMEGISQEAISLAGHLRLSKLIVLWDNNSISIDGPTSLAVSDNEAMRFQASGWNTAKVDGHNPVEIRSALAAAQNSDKPTLIACKTIIGFGAPHKQGTNKAHGDPLGVDEVKAARVQLGWPYPAFEIPAPILASWRDNGKRNADVRTAWETRAATTPKSAFGDPVTSEVAAALRNAAHTAGAQFIADKAKIATRQSSQKVIEALLPAMPALLGGSADLTGSNGTLTKLHSSVTPDNFSGNYIHYGVREHGMAAAMNGIALHGGLVPYGGTFLCFSDYCRPAIRLAALMRQRVVFVMTHDSIGLGEDGPTHQPVEHLSALRAIPNLRVFRPADAVETAECWELALTTNSAPSILALTRQALPTMRTDAHENQSAKGAYVLAKADGKRAVTLVASGSEVEIAMAAREKLAREGIAAAVVSMPSMELFAAQPVSYRAEVLGTGPIVAVEAGVQMSWDRWLKPGDRFIGMHTFGASAPIAKLYEHFGITAETVAAAAKAIVQG